MTTERACTCHPDDNPPTPCEKQYALGECRKKAEELKSEQQEPVAWRYKKPVCNEDGSLIGYSDWILTTTKDYMEWWPHDNLFLRYAAPPDLVAENERLRFALENCRLLAARHRKEDWALLILGFCAEAGIVGSVTR